LFVVDVDVNIVLNVSHLAACRKEVDPGVPCPRGFGNE